MNRCIILFFVLFPLFSKAGISVEPFLGYSGNYFQWQKQLYQGPTLGARVGYKRWGLMIGIDATYHSAIPFASTIGSLIIDRMDPTAGLTALGTSTEIKESNQDSPATYHVLTFGPSVSFGLPFIIDAYFTLIGYATAQNEHHNLTGSGFKFGASYINLPFVSLNLEYQGMYYYECLNQQNQPCSATSQSPATGTAHSLSVFMSVPINTGFL